ncbi:AAA family ATPase [Actinomadura sp. DC4]|uniref:ATP-dependent nuclease n=1 Tax=Actinomadura sp. DC4 TaxID=3055069 RepID=UPI0025B0CBDC|nr:AAA family ATPase [Actinomadura sp. DC4]MDN3351806.1 AAA family ATPase [Actinomadura sp. DC4]
MNTPFRVTNLSFNGDTSIDVQDADVVVLIGPNNTGKSRTLQEISDHLSLGPGQPVPQNAFLALSDVAIDKRMSGYEVNAWLKERRYTWSNHNDLRERIHTTNVGELYLDQVVAVWDAHSGGRLGALANHLVRGLWCGERLGYLGSPGRLEMGAHPDHAIHLLTRDEQLKSSFREALFGAFGMNTIVDAWGNSIRLRVSRVDTQEDFATTSTDGFADSDTLQRLSALPPIESQSDGVRSFAGILLTLLAAQYPLVLIDEPEAFLHPPQARLIGKYITELKGEGQVFVATHSLDILLGLIEAQPDRVSIIRLTRDSDLTSAQSLPRSQLAKLWRDPFLRFSRSLDGLFHDAVIVCEGDTDCQFYSAIAENVRTTGSSPYRRDVMFTYAGSKHRIPTVTAALRALGVPVRVVVDFDALNDESVLKNLVESVGGEYTSEMTGDRNLLDSQIRGSGTVLTVGAIRGKLAQLLGDKDDRKMTSAMIRAIRQLTEPETGWRAAKKSGTSVVPSGDASAALQRLLASLQAVGVFVVPAGEVESFVKAVPGKGPRWAVEVAEGGYLDSAVEAQRFIQDLWSSL